MYINVQKQRSTYIICNVQVYIATFSLLSFMLRSILFLIVAVLILGISSCTVVKPYQRVYLNDTEMQIGIHSVQKIEQDAQTIREGATSPGGAKSSGGCGCN